MHDHDSLHEHLHQHTYTHSHPHEHGEGHENDHAHSHAGVGGTEHSHGAAAGTVAGQTEALLRYMLEHNRHHADELHELAHRLEEEGQQSAANQLHEALHLFDAGNTRLEEALSALLK